MSDHIRDFLLLTVIPQQNFKVFPCIFFFFFMITNIKFIIKVFEKRKGLNKAKYLGEHISETKKLYNFLHECLCGAVRVVTLYSNYSRRTKQHVIFTVKVLRNRERRVLTYRVTGNGREEYTVYVT